MMLSRVAEDVYWLARYIERAENTARLINVNTNLLLDLPKGISTGWRSLIDISGSEALFDGLYQEPDERSVLRFLLGDMRHSGSILFCLYHARENSRTVRDIVPRESWEQINNLYLYAKNHLQSGLSKRGRYEYLKWIILGAQLNNGLLAGTMSHDAAYNFLRMGRNLERADMTTRIIDVRSANLLPETDSLLAPYDNIQWMSVLKSLTGYQMYRRHLQTPVRRPDVLKFLFQNQDFPRSFYHCVSEVENCLHKLPRNDAPLRVLAGVQRMVHEANVALLAQQELHDFIDELQLGLVQIDEQIHTTYFRAEHSAGQLMASSVVAQ